MQRRNQYSTLNPPAARPRSCRSGGANKHDPLPVFDAPISAVTPRALDELKTRVARTTWELVVGTLSRGYGTNRTPTNLATYLLWALRRDLGRDHPLVQALRDRDDPDYPNAFAWLLAVQAIDEMGSFAEPVFP